MRNIVQYISMSLDGDSADTFRKSRLAGRAK